MKFTTHKTMLLLLLGASTLAVCSSGTTTFALPMVGEAEDDDGVLCDWSNGERMATLSRALLGLRDEYEIIQGNLSFHQGGNPQGKYGIVHLPGDQLPYALKKASKTTAGFPLPIEASFLLGPRDALFWFGCTPPPVRYFSLRSYLAYKFPQQGESETGSRFNLTGFMPAAELGDPLNHAVIQSTGGPGNPFSKTTLVVSTGDQGTYRHVREAFREAGLPEWASNLDVVPQDLVRFRNDHLPWAVDRADTIAWQFRVNEFINPSEAQAYLDKVWPVFMVRPKNNGVAGMAQPLQAPPLKKRGTGESEEWLRAPLGELVAAVEARMATERGLKLTHTFPMAPSIPDSLKCINEYTTYCPVAKPIPAWNRSDCLPSCDWFTRDSLYSTPPDDSDFENFLMPKGRVLMVVGVNHALLGKAAFQNFLATGIKNPERPGHTPNFTSAHLAGSAQYYLPDFQPMSDLLYSQELNRDCGSSPARAFCETVTEECIGFDEPIYFAERAYLEPTTTIGPSPDEMISPMVLAFDPMSNEEMEVMRMQKHKDEQKERSRPGKKAGAAAKLRGQAVAAGVEMEGEHSDLAANQ